MNITDASHRQFEIGIDMFLEGHTVVYHEICFRIARDGVLHIASYADQIYRENITTQHASEKIARSKDVYADLRSRSERFAVRVSVLPVRYECCHDYGTAAVVVATEDAGVVKVV
jgi:hypothetical protein